MAAAGKIADNLATLNRASTICNTPAIEIAASTSGIADLEQFLSYLASRNLFADFSSGQCDHSAEQCGSQPGGRSADRYIGAA